MIDRSPRETSLIARIVRQLTPPHEPPHETPSDLARTEVHRLLASERRQYTLEHLDTIEDTVTVRKLADQVAAAENDCALHELTSQERKRASVSLVQTHLPRFADADVVVYDDEYRTVRRGPEFPTVWAAYTTVRQALND